MLVSFSVSNYLSFDETVTLSMEKTLTKQHKDHLIDDKYLSGCVLYGANASGKTNLLQALWTLSNIVNQQGNIDNFNIVFNKFAFTNEQVSTFIVVYIINNKKYEYSVSVSQDEVINEELSLINSKDKKNNIFARNNATLSKLGKMISSEKWYKQRTFPKNILYLSKLRDDGIEDIPELYGKEHFLNSYNFFENIEFITGMPKIKSDAFYMIPKINEFKSFLTELLHFADTGIDNVELEPISDFERSPRFINIAIKDNSAILTKKMNDFYFLVSENGKREVKKLITFHNGKRFILEQESSGTVKLIELAAVLYYYESYNKDICLMIDEFDSSLHPILVKQLLIKLLKVNECNKSQILTTLHDVLLLDIKDIWRADEVWFVEKDHDQSSQIYSLADFNPQSNKSVDKDYLVGKYGAIPFIEAERFWKMQLNDKNEKRTNIDGENST